MEGQAVPFPDVISLKFLRLLYLLPTKTLSPPAMTLCGEHVENLTLFFVMHAQTHGATQQ